MNSKDCPFMSIEEMRKHEWTINYVRMMYDYYFSAVLPVMDRFLDECISLFRDVYVKDKRILYPNTNNWVKEYIKDRGLVCENS